MLRSREIPYPVNEEIENLAKFEPFLYQPANNGLCKLTPNLLIDALVLEGIGGLPPFYRLVNNRFLHFGQGFEAATPLPTNRLNPNYAQSILLKHIGQPAGVILGDPYQGLIVSTPQDPTIFKRGVFVNRLWNDYHFARHLEVDALTNEENTPHLSANQRRKYEQKVLWLAQHYTWASQAFLHLLKTLDIYIDEADFAVTRPQSSSHQL